MVPACARNELSHASAAPLVDVVDDPVAVVPVHVGLVHGAVLVLALCGSTTCLDAQSLVKLSVQASPRRCRHRCRRRSCGLKPSRRAAIVASGLAIVRKHGGEANRQLDGLDKSFSTYLSMRSTSFDLRPDSGVECSQGLLGLVDGKIDVGVRRGSG